MRIQGISGSRGVAVGNVYRYIPVSYTHLLISLYGAKCFHRTDTGYID